MEDILEGPVWKGVPVLQKELVCNWTSVPFSFRTGEDVPGSCLVKEVYGRKKKKKFTIFRKWLISSKVYLRIEDGLSVSVSFSFLCLIQDGFQTGRR